MTAQEELLIVIANARTKGDHSQLEDFLSAAVLDGFKIFERVDIK